MDDSKRTAQIRARLAGPADEAEADHISDLLHLLCELDAEREHRRTAEAVWRDGERLERDLAEARKRIDEITVDSVRAEQVHNRLYAGLVFTRHLCHQAADAGRDMVPVDLVDRALDGDIAALRDYEDPGPRPRPCQDHQAVDGDREPCDELRAAAATLLPEHINAPDGHPWHSHIRELLLHIADDMQDDSAYTYVAGNGAVYVRPLSAETNEHATRYDWSAALWAARAINQATP